MTIITIEKKITEEQKKKIMEAIKAIIPNDMFCHSSRMSTEVIAAKIWTKADVRGEIENSGHELTEDLLNKTLKNMGKMDQLNDSLDYEWNFIQGAVNDSYEELIEELGWGKSDDNQYIKKLRDGVYRLVQSGKMPDDSYIVYMNTIILANWMDSDGMYDADCTSIVESYYGSVENFKSEYTDPDDQQQILAEMIFESTASHGCEAREIVTEENVQKTIDKFLRLHA